MDSTKLQIIHEIAVALADLDAPADLQAAVNSWGDTMGDDDTLLHLRTFNETGTIFASIICATPEAMAERDLAMARHAARTVKPA